LRGELVEPKKPIIFYIDPATPARWIPYLIQAVNDWQPAFERAGFKNAIIAKVAPTKEQDSSWSLEDARYSAIVWKSSVVPNATGPNVHDPRTGEILESHINWYHNVLRLVHNWYMIQCAAVDTRARKMEFDDELMGQLIRFVCSHEVGHTLGLVHNFGSSSTVSIDSLRNKAWVEANGHTPSIMDYARFNYVAQPEDNIGERGLFPRIGDYDKWAIEWGYKILPGNLSAKDETSVLNKWVIEKLQNKRLWFGRENNKDDPRSQNEDLGNDAMKAGGYGINNLKFVLSHLQDWTSGANEGYANLTEIYAELLNQFGRYIGHITKNIGGIYETPNTVEQNRPVYQIVPKSIQKDAVLFLNQQLFTTPKWVFNYNIIDRVGFNPVKIAGVLQNGALDKILSVATLTKLIKAEAENGVKAYNILDLFGDLHKNIWRELYLKSSIDVYRRNLQKEYISDISALLISPPPSPFSMLMPDPTQSDISSIARAELVRLNKEIKRSLPFISDKPSKYHLQDVLMRIDKMLNTKAA
jgi:hypothetical protein